MQTFKNPILQKRHYEFIADILKDIRNVEITIEEVIEVFADEFAKSNPMFDKKKFLDRIGVNNESN